MRFLYGLVAAATICSVTEQVSCQCTFGATFNSKTWRDNTKGNLTFTATRMTGWNFKSTKTTGTSTIVPTWLCVNHTNDDYLVLRTRTTFSYQPLYQTGTKPVYAYMCLKLTNITDYSFIYYQQQVQDIRLGGERLKVSEHNYLYQGDVCDTTVSIPTPEYHVLVLSGNESNAAIQCPDSLLITADYYFINNDNSTTCNETGDSLLDVCSNNTSPTFNYTICNQQIAFSATGLFYCVASVSYSGYDYTTVYNRDTTVSGTTTRRFSCICKSGSYMSVAPSNCTSYQNPFDFPLLADQTTPTGHRLVIQKQYSYCGTTVTNTTGLTAGEIAAIVVSLLLLLYIWTVSTIVLIAVAFFTLRTIFVLLLEFTDVTDHIPVTKPPTSVTPDLLKHKTDIDREQSTAGPESVHVHVHIPVKEPIKEKEKVHNGHAKKGDNKETKGEQQTVNENKTSQEAVNSDSKDKSPKSKPFIV